MSRANPIDLRQFNLSATGIAAFAKKADAVAFAKASGWSPANVGWACNRFWMFFVVSQVLDTDGTRRILLKDKAWIDVPYATKKAAA